MDIGTNDVTKTTYSIADFVEYQRAGSLDLRPFYQRRSVWNSRLKSQLIDSVIRGYPIPLIFLHTSLDVEASKTMRNVVDGQQRLRTILSFVDPTSIKDLDETDRFSLLKIHNPEYGGMRFNDLPAAVRRQILETHLSVNVLPANVQDATILRMFQRLNSTGVKLSNQELRNAQYSGWFKSLSYDLAYEQLQRWQQWKLFRQDQIAQMAEVEFTSDLLGMIMRGVENGSKSAIDRLYSEHEGDQAPGNVDEIADQFRVVCDALDLAWGSDIPTSKYRSFRNKSWAYGLAYLTHHQRGEVDVREVLDAAEQRLDDAKRQDPELAKSLRGATTHKANRQTRIDFLKACVS